MVSLGAIRPGSSVAWLRHRRSVVGVRWKGGLAGSGHELSSTPSTPWRSILGGSPGSSGVVSGDWAPEGGLPEPVGGAYGYLHTYLTTRTLLLAQDRGWTRLAAIFFIALLDYHTPDR